MLYYCCNIMDRLLLNYSFVAKLLLRYSVVGRLLLCCSVAIVL